MRAEYQINCLEEGRPFPHYWEHCVGSCHAATLLRSDVQEHIRNAHRDCGFRYIRCHGLFNDDMSVVFPKMFGLGKPIISFYNIDCVYDFLLSAGMKPFVELGFMPSALASGTQTCFHYKGNVTMPKDFDQWDNLIRSFAEHLIERYGKEEVEQWPFEVWNEPNLNFFFDGTQEDYFTLYAHTARALKSVDSSLKVGGPATSVNAWIPEFKAYCAANDVPLDFITTHHYPSDDPLSDFGQNGPGKKGRMFDEETMKQVAAMPPEQLEALLSQFTVGKENQNPRDILSRMAKKAKEEAGELPLIYTEWNGSKEFDTCYQSAFILHTIAHNEGLVDGYSFWCVSDIFEEMGMKPGPFKNEFGLQTNHGIPKPSYRAFQILHEAGDRRLSVQGEHDTVEVLALKSEKQITVIVYNHDIERRDVKAETVRIALQGSVQSVRKAVIDEENCNPLSAWEKLGKPEYLTAAQTQQIHKAAQLEYEGLPVADGAQWSAEFTALPESVTVFKVELA
ncbi:MAG: beta-xylosidase [Faecousia sp.]